MVDLKMENIISGFLIFSILVALSIGIYTGMEDNYDIMKGDVDDSGNNIMDNLKNLNIVTGMDDIVTGLHDLTAPGGDIFDIGGGLKAVGIGFLRLATGVITTPIEIMAIIVGFYYIPSEVYIGIGLIFIIYIGFMIVNKFTDYF